MCMMWQNRVSIYRFTIARYGLITLATIARSFVVFTLCHDICHVGKFHYLQFHVRHFQSTPVE